MGDMRNAYNNLERKPQETTWKTHTWEDTIKIGAREIRCERED